MSINIFDAYQHPGKWCEVVSPMCTPSNRLCETTATCWYLTSHGKASTIYLSIISGLQRARRDYLLTRTIGAIICRFRWTLKLMISKFDRAESVTVTTAASATHLHSQLKSARLNYSTCAMDVNVKREYEPACTCGQYLEQFEVNVRTFGDSSSTFKFHEEATSIVLSGPAWAPWIHLPITSKLHLSLSQLILSVALSAYIGRRLVHLYLWRQLLGTPNL